MYRRAGCPKFQPMSVSHSTASVWNTSLPRSMKLKDGQNQLLLLSQCVPVWVYRCVSSCVLKVREIYPRKLRTFQERRLWRLSHFPYGLTCSLFHKPIQRNVSSSLKPGLERVGMGARAGREMPWPSEKAGGEGGQAAEHHPARWLTVQLVSGRRICELFPCRPENEHAYLR